VKKESVKKINQQIKSSHKEGREDKEKRGGGEIIGFLIDLNFLSFSISLGLAL
jgi:hypothetical protein